MALESSVLLLLEVISGVTQALACDNDGKKTVATILEANLAIPMKPIIWEIHIPLVPALLLQENHPFDIFAQVDKIRKQPCSSPIMYRSKI